MRYLTACFILLFVALCGCWSYRFVATGEKADYIPTKKYKLANLTIQVPLGVDKLQRNYNNEVRFVHPDWWSIPQAASLYNIEKLQSMIIQQLPNVFSDDASAIPIDIHVRCMEEDNYLDWTGFFGAASLGVLPFMRRITSTCEVGVNCLSGITSKKGKTKIFFQTDLMYTGSSPIGLIPFSRVSGAISQMVKTKVDEVSSPHREDALNDAVDVATVFCEAISSAIVVQLKLLETGNL